MLRRVLLCALVLSRAAVTPHQRPKLYAGLTVESRPLPSRAGLLSLPNGCRHVLASALSGAAGVTMLAPLEMLRVNMMINREWSLQQTFSALRKRGAWYSGNRADVFSAAARVGVTMPVFALYKRALRRVVNGPGSEEQPQPGWTIFAAGALAGCTASLLVFPLDLVRTRMAIECDITSISGCLAGITAAEGPLGMYRGMSATLIGVIPFNAIKLSSYDYLRKRAIKGKDDASTALPLSLTARFGAIAGVVSSTSCFPLEVVRRRQMVGEFADKTVFGAIGAIAKSDGAVALFRGWRLNVFKVALGNCVGFVLYELMKDLMEVDGRPSPLRALALPLPTIARPAVGAPASHTH